LDVVLELCNLLLKLVERDLLVFDNQVDLELLDTETQRNQRGGTPDQTVLLDGADGLLELLHVGLVVPWLDIHGDNRLGSWLGLACLLLGVLSETLFSDTSGLGIFLLVVTSEEINIVVILLLLGSLGGVDGKLAGLWSVGGVWLGRVTWEGREFGLVRGDVLVPAVGMGELLRCWGSLDGLEGLDIGLGRTVAFEVLAFCRHECGCIDKTRQRMLGISVAQSAFGSNRIAGS